MQDLRAVHCVVPSALDATEKIVRRGIQRIERQRDTLDPGVGDAGAEVLRNHHAVGSNHNPQTVRVGVRGDLEYVFAQERLAAGQDEQRFRVHLANLVDDSEAFLGGELVLGLGLGDAPGADVAVLAAQVALFGQVPADDVTSKEHRSEV